MGFLELFLIGVGLSMDAFAVAICQGLSMTRIKWGHALTVGLYCGGFLRLSLTFGFFQFLMPVIGWALGLTVRGFIESWDHWIAFALLAWIGGNMIREALSGEEDEAEDAAASGRLDHKKLFLMAIATSIDALAVGVTFAFLETPILSAVSLIGVTTFWISVAGVAVGCWFGARYKQRAEITGGVILVLLGCKILLEHLGLLSF